MKRLSLFRHAEAADRIPGTDDFARPLTPRGREDAKRMGAVLSSRQPLPDLALCSPSLRTRQTLKCARMPESLETVMDPEIYEATVQDLLHLIRTAPQSCAYALVVGHNPGMQLLALALASPSASNPDDLRKLTKKFPKGALATFEFDVTDWSEIGLGRGRLTGFNRPKDVRA